MDNITYRKNVFKTLSIKPAKIGLRHVAKNTLRTNVFHASIGLGTEGGELVAGLASYITGSSRITPEMLVNAFEEMGDLGYYMSVLCKCLKVKLPASSKKVKLKGMTRSEAVLKLMSYTAAIADLAKKNMYGVSTKPITKEVSSETVDPLGNKTTIVSLQIAEVYDPVETELVWSTRRDKIKAILQEQFVPLYWALCFDLFDAPPANVFVGNIGKLSKRFEKGFFNLSEAEERDTDAEMQAMQEN